MQSATQAAASGSRCRLLLAGWFCAEDPALNKDPEPKEEADDQDRASIVVKEHRRRDADRSRDSGDDGNTQQVQQHRARDADDDDLEASLERMAPAQPRDEADTQQHQALPSDAVPGDEQRVHRSSAI